MLYDKRIGDAETKNMQDVSSSKKNPELLEKNDRVALDILDWVRIIGVIIGITGLLIYQITK